MTFSEYTDYRKKHGRAPETPSAFPVGWYNQGGQIPSAMFTVSGNTITGNQWHSYLFDVTTTATTTNFKWTTTTS